jgi:hypothetical protein
MSSWDEEAFFEQGQGAALFDAFRDEEIEFAVDAAGLLADAQVIDDLQMFPSVFESGSGKVSILGGCLDEDAEALTLFNLIAAEPNVRLTLAQVRGVADQSVRLYRQANRISQITNIPPELQEFSRQINAANEHISLIRLVLVTRGVAPAKTLEDYAIEGTRVRVDIFDSIRLNRAAGSSVSREDIAVNFEELTGSPLSCLAVRERDGSDFDTYLAAIPGNALCSMYAEFNTRLLELNVRAFLGVCPSSEHLAQVAA